MKLDRELVAGLPRERRLQDLVGAVVAMCDRLGASCVAEGIETAGELHAVRGAGVRYGQGFLLARPASRPPQVARM